MPKPDKKSAKKPLDKKAMKKTQGGLSAPTSFGAQQGRFSGPALDFNIKAGGPPEPE